MKNSLSIRQNSILQFIKDFLNEHPYPPTIRDIRNGCNISSTSVVDYNLQILQRKGFIQRQREVSRGIQLIGKSPTSQDVLELPVVFAAKHLSPIAVRKPSPVKLLPASFPNNVLFEEKGLIRKEI